ncbi:hypothetical protein INT43_007213 [Umbelopsis isabellina]|uniref:MICOS complex subunit MIC60 n=1 Tax=Mortierella isabellina TaxID=91625 RepID=A0A8H7UE34_MORIS|nr:hypothetical protein INT43_007213 [Umbelopsis isabellina]
MLRAITANGLRSSRISPNHGSRAVIKRLQTTNGNVEKPSPAGSTGTVLLVLGSITALSFTGATVYSTRDEIFRNSFVEYVPGAKAAVQFLADLERGDSVESYHGVSSIRQQAEEYGSTLKSYTQKAKNASLETYEYAQDAYAKLTGKKEIPKLTSRTLSLPDENATKTVERVIEEDEGTKRDTLVHKKVAKEATDFTDAIAISQQTASDNTVVDNEDHIDKIKEKISKVVEPIILGDIKLENSEIQSLRRTLIDLTELLNQAKLSDVGRGAITDADHQLSEIDQQLNHIQSLYNEVLNFTKQACEKFDELGGIFNVVNDDYAGQIYIAQQYTVGEVDKKEKELTEIFSQERQAMVAEFNEKLTKQMDEERNKFIAKKTAHLEGQYEKIEAQHEQLVQSRVESEAGGRFGELDKLIASLAVLEKKAQEAATFIDDSQVFHQLAVAISALDRVTDHEGMQPFPNELSTLRNVVENTDGLQKQIMDIVIASIPEGLEYEGVQSISELRRRFDFLAEEVRQSSLVSTEGGMVSHMISISLSKLMFKKHGLVPGDDVEARLARAEYYLNEHDLESATREMNQLTGWPKKLASGWIESARKRLEVKQVIKIVEAEIALSKISI